MPTSITGFRQGEVLSYANERFNRIAFTEWGDPDSEHVVVCVHGLSRQGRDFDALATALAGRGCRVVCPDLIGRGRSDRLEDPTRYGLPQYASDMATLIARLGVRRLDWIGTSLGALIGMVIAAARETPVRRFVVNDIGPSLPWSALRRIGENVRSAPRVFPDLAAGAAYLREVHAPFGRLTDSQWRHMAQHSFTPNPDGGVRPHYDPGIVATFRFGTVYNVSFWRYWDNIRCPVLLLRGEQSDLLTVEIADEMTRRGPRAELVTIPDCGHAPALMDQGQIDLVSDWIMSP